MNFDPNASNECLEPQTTPEPKGSTFVSTLFDVLEMFAWAVFVVMILFSFVIRLCRVDGESMENTLQDGQNLILYSLNYKPEQDDIIVFHLTSPDSNPPMEKTLVKRVIATEGQKIEINFRTAVITIDGKVYEDSHATLKDIRTDEIIDRYTSRNPEHSYDINTGIFSATVPEGTVFVMGDNRNNSLDSRYLAVGFVDERCILGKVVFRILPFTSYLSE